MTLDKPLYGRPMGYLADQAARRNLGMKLEATRSGLISSIVQFDAGAEREYFTPTGLTENMTAEAAQIAIDSVKARSSNIFAMVDEIALAVGVEINIIQDDTNLLKSCINKNETRRAVMPLGTFYRKPSSSENYGIKTNKDF